MFEGAYRRVRTDDSDDLDSRGSAPSEIGVGSGPGIAEAPEPLPLSLVYRREGMPERGASPGLDLDDAEKMFPLRDYIELALRTPPVAVEDAIAVCRQVLSGAVFTRPPEVVFRCHGDSMRVMPDPRPA